MRFIRNIILSLALLLATPVWADVVITEFLASNQNGLLDEDGATSDWIELYNDGAAPVNLSGWRFTDDSADLFKWTFPAVTIEPKGFLIVFASNKDRAVATAPLHTNFKLNSDGGYLALVRPDTTFSTVFNPYPAQYDDKPYGFAQTVTTTQLLSSSSSVKFLIPTSSTPNDATWTARTFNDASWTSATAGIGFDSTSASGYAALIGASGNCQTAMMNNTPSAYARFAFNVANPATVTSLTMPIKYDDGFVAYLNGVEVARRNAPAGVPTNTTAATANHVAVQAKIYESIDLTPYVNQLIAGTNVLAIHGLNETAASTDFLIKVELDQYSVTVGTTEGYYASATPGAFNTAAVYNKVAPVLINVGRGIYTTAQSITLSCSTPGATIRYTYDGSSPFQLTTAGAIVRDGSGNPVPSPTSGVYSAPLTISSTKTLRYAAFKNGSDPSDSVTQTYLFLSDVITQSPSTSGSGVAPVITNPPGASPATTIWPSGSVNGQVLDYGIDPNVTTSPTYSGTILNDMKAVPSVSIVTDVPNLFDNSIGIYANPSGDTITWERPASIELISKTGTSEFQANCGLRIRGGYSRSTGNPKHGLRIFFRDTYGPSKINYALFGSDPTGATKFDSFDLRCPNNYAWSFSSPNLAVYIRDTFSRQTQLDMGQLSSHTVYFHLYLNGQYWGLYNVDERPEANFGSTYLGGDPSDYDTIKSAPDLGYTNFATDGDEVAWNSLWTQADSGLSASNTEIVNNTNYQKIIGNNPNGTPNPAYPVLVEADGLVDYNLCIYWSGNLDAAISAFLGNNNPNNWFGFRDRTGAHGGFRFVLHDSEHTLLNVNENRTGPWPAGSTASQGANAYPRSSPQYIFQQLIKAQQFKMLFADRVYKHFANGGALTPTAALARFNLLTTEIDRAIVGESARWGNAQSNPSRTRNTDWVPATDVVRNNFLPTRTSNVLAQFRAQGWYPTFDPPLWSQRGGTINSGATITLSFPAGQSGTIYYTIDGTDPRSYNSTTGAEGVSATALVYSGPITIPNSRTIRTRVRNATNWSAIDEATFYTPQDFTKIVVSEINYNPTDLGAISGDELEFLELKNIGSANIDLGGCTFTNGITYTFPNGTFLAPGGFYVLARDATVNQASFHTRYPGVTVSGIYTGRLDNNGETITLAAPTGGNIFSLTYDDALPWPVSADGNGFTAVPKATVYNSNDGVNWRGSANIFGSPGTDDPAVTTSVVINEILTNSALPLKDTIELFNPTNASVDVSDWWLTDDPNVPKKYRIPATTNIPAGGYAVFNEDQFNVTTPLPGNINFALNSAGDDVYLFSGDSAGNLTGYSHGFAFAGAEQNVSFGRIVTSAGDEYFPRQISNTFSAINSGPKVGPLVINEIMYHPYTGYDEFVEIRNISNATVPLYDPANPANTWKVGGLAYTFAAGQSIPAGGYALVVGIAPSTFRTKYNVPMSVQIFGPYTGSLQNNGERISLEMPDTPFLNGLGQTVIPYDVIDTVRYNNIAPWPLAADGSGPSLQRTVSSTFGDDPANWFADGITGGFPNAADILPSISIASPATNSPYTAPATVTFTSTVSDSDGSIIKVEYFSGINKLGESTVAPDFSFVWTSTPGTHTITAKATDNSLGTTVSAPITVYVTPTITQGLKGDYYGNKTLTAPIAGTRTDAFSSTNAINFSISSSPAWPTNYGFPNLTTTNFSVRWSGQIRATATGSHTFSTVANDGVRLFVNGTQIISNWNDVADAATATTGSSSIALTSGQLYDIVLEYYQNTGTGSINLKWVVPGSFQNNVPQTVLYPDSVPIIVNHPAAVSKDQGQSATFTALASGHGLTYQWRKNGQFISGATSQTYTIPYVTPGDAAQYSVFVSNSYGFAISNNAQLTVTFTDTDSDGIQDWWESLYFGTNTAAVASQDSDGDGMTNLQEYLAGTDPNDPNSKFSVSIATSISGPGYTLTFTAMPYKSYTIQYKDTLTATSWTTLQSYSATPVQQTISYTDPAGTSMRFYRIATP